MPTERLPQYFSIQRDFFVCEGTPRTNESSFMLVFWFYLNLIVSRETIHKRENFTSCSTIYNLIYKWCGIVFLRTGFIEVSKVCTNADSPLLLINRNRIGYPFCQSDGIDKTSLQQLFNLCIHSRHFARVNRS